MPKLPHIRVRNSGIVLLKKFNNRRGGGNLFVPESVAKAGLHLPIAGSRRTFLAQRFFFIQGVTDMHSRRANHAHRNTSEVIFCVQGSCTLSLHDGQAKQRITLRDPSIGIIHGPDLWHSISRFSKDCVLLAFADSPVYEPGEYISDYQEFIQLISSVKKKR